MINIKISSWAINWDGFDDKWLDGNFFEGTFLSTGTNIKISFLFKSICMFKKTCVPIYYLVADIETRISSSHKQTNISSNRKGKGRWSK